MGRTEEAIVEYREALRINPANASALSNFGVALLELGNLEEALAHGRQALALKPTSESIQNSLVPPAS